MTMIAPSTETINVVPLSKRRPVVLAKAKPGVDPERITALTLAEGESLEQHAKRVHRRSQQAAYILS